SFIRHKGLNPGRWACETLPHPIEQDETACGVFVLKFAACILRDCQVEFDASPPGINVIREEIAVRLLENTDDLTELCHLCGMQDGDTHWIGCDLCPRWYHRSCAKQPDTERMRTFHCLACQ
ncbi:PHD finger protein ALFIN-LIKE 1-like, partial [Sparus aurata]